MSNCLEHPKAAGDTGGGAVDDTSEPATGGQATQCLRVGELVAGEEECAKGSERRHPSSCRRTLRCTQDGLPSDETCSERSEHQRESEREEVIIRMHPWYTIELLIT